MSFFLPPLPPKWSAALRDVTAQRPESRMAAARRLGQPVDAEQSRAAFAALERLSTDLDARVRGAAVTAFGELIAANDDVSVEPRAAELGATAPPPSAAESVRGAALPLSATRLDSDVALRTAVGRVLRPRLTDSDPSVRELAALGLAELGWEVVPDALADALRSEYPEVRFQALGAAAQSGGARAAQQVVSLLDDPDPYVRTAAVRAAGMLAPNARPDAVTAKLRAALRDPAYAVRCEAGIALAEEADVEATDALLESLSDPEHLLDALDAAPHLPDERVRERVAYLATAVLGSRLIVAAAGRALARMHDPRGIAVLRHLLTGFRTHGRTIAVQTIGELRLSELTRDLVRLSDCPRAVDPSTLATSLANLAQRDSTAAAALQKLASRRDEYGQAARTTLSEDARLKA